MLWIYSTVYAQILNFFLYINNSKNKIKKQFHIIENSLRINIKNKIYIILIIDKSSIKIYTNARYMCRSWLIK